MATKKITGKQLRNKNVDTKVTIGGREYEITFNMGVLAELEDIYGSVEKAMDALNKQSVKSIINLMYAVMKQEDGNEDLTVRQVGKMLDLNFMEEIIRKSGIAINKDFGESESQENSEVGEK